MAIGTLVRRLRAHDWIAVAIEVVIVVAGVFIALQVSNWNEERKDARRGDDYLGRLRDELHADVVMIARMTEFRRSVQAEGRAALAHAETGVLLEDSAWKTLRAYYQASQIWPYRKPAVTFEEIRSSGDLALIRDAALRARIAAHYSDNAGSGIAEVLQYLPAYRETVRGATPWAVQDYIWKNCYRTEGQMQEMIDCPSPIPEAEAAAILGSFPQHPELLPQLRLWLATNQLGGILLEQVGIEADALATDIDAALPRGATAAAP